MELNCGGRIEVLVERPTEAIIIPPPHEEGNICSGGDVESMWQMSFREGENMDSEPYPERPGEKDCAFYLKTGHCRFGDTCRYNHPPDRNLAVERMKGAYPERIGQPECQYYLKTGTCKFGPTCKFHHPKDNAGITGRVQFNVLGYPLRPNEKECAYYLRTGQCKFSNTCKFNHPEPSNAMLLLHSLTTPGQQSYAGGLASFIASPSWQGHSGYAQLILSQGLVQVPSWNTFPEILGSSSSPEGQQQNVGNGQFVGTSHQNGTTMDSSASLSSDRFGSFLMEQHGLQRASIFPQRPGEPECQFYKKTGDCKFGASCRFHHPRERMSPTPDCMLSPVGLPLRPGEAVCIFYDRYGLCKYGPACKYDHPIAAPKGIVANNPSTSSSPDVPVVQQLFGSSSGPPELTLSSESSPLSGSGSGSGKFRFLSLSNSPQMNSDEENVESE